MRLCRYWVVRSVYQQTLGHQNDHDRYDTYVHLDRRHRYSIYLQEDGLLEVDLGLHLQIQDHLNPISLPVKECS